MPLYRRFFPTRVYLLTVFEALLTACCFAAACYICLPVAPGLYLIYENGLARIELVAALYLIVNYLFGFYNQIYVRSRIVNALRVCQLLGSLLIIHAVIAFINPDLILPQTVVLLGTAMTAAVLMGWQIFIRPRLLRAFGTQSVLFVGWNRATEALHRMIVSEPAMSMRTVGCIVENAQSVPPGIPVFDSYEDIEDLVMRLRPGRIVVASEDITDRRLMEALFRLRAIGCRIEAAGTLYESTFGRIYAPSIRPQTLLFRDDLSARPMSLALQAIYTNLIALAGLVLISPALLIIGLAILLTRGRPVLEKIPCLGLHGIPFRVYRFRIERHSRFEKFLSQYKLDVLPGLFNIVRGEMSLIGPRPERVEFGDVLSELIPYYRQRYVVKPGVMGWSQLRCDPMPEEDTLARIEYDLYYIKHISLILDMYIIVQGIKTMLASQEA